MRSTDQVQRERSRNTPASIFAASSENKIHRRLLLQKPNQFAEFYSFLRHEVEQNRLPLACKDNVCGVGCLLEARRNQFIEKIDGVGVMGEAVIGSDNDIRSAQQPQCFDLGNSPGDAL